MAIKAKTPEEITLMRASGAMVSDVLAQIAGWIRPGLTGLELDKMVADYIASKGAKASFKGYEGFPASVCLSVNEEVVHGIPKGKAFKDGDIISADVGVYLNGYHGDMAYTFGIGNVKEETLQLMRRTKESLRLGIAQAVTGKRTGDIGHAIQSYCEGFGYGIVRELVGHGLGKTLHEDPQVPNYGKAGSGVKLITDCTIAIEPMINMGRRNVYTAKDNWTIVTQDGKPSAHFEHTLLVQPNAPELLTNFAVIEAAVEANGELVKI